MRPKYHEAGLLIVDSVLESWNQETLLRRGCRQYTKMRRKHSEVIRQSPLLQSLRVVKGQSQFRSKNFYVCDRPVGFISGLDDESTTSARRCVITSFSSTPTLKLWTNANFSSQVTPNETLPALNFEHRYPTIVTRSRSCTKLSGANHFFHGRHVGPRGLHHGFHNNIWMFAQKQPMEGTEKPRESFLPDLVLQGQKCGEGDPDDNPIKSTALSSRRLMKVMLLGMHFSGTI